MSHHPVGQGHGEAGQYAGLPEEFTNLETAKIAIVPVAFDKTTTYQHGTEKGPDSLIEASRNLELYDIETDSEVYQQGIHTSATLWPETSEEMIDVVYKTVADLIKKGKFVVTLGGEHAISFAPIKAHVEAYPNISILQFDAHADLQDAYEGNPLSHASVMARVLELPNIKNIVSVGIRSMSVEEKDNLPKTIPYFAHNLFDSDDWMDDVVAKLGDQVYITFDLDVFDSSVMSSTGTPEPGGLFWHQVAKLLKKVIQKKHLIGFDVVELCPKEGNPAPDFLAAKLVYKILSYRYAK